LCAIKNTLQPLAEFTSLLSSEEFTTISSALPTIMDLHLHLEEMKSSSDRHSGEVAKLIYAGGFEEMIQEIYRSL